MPRLKTLLCLLGGLTACGGEAPVQLVLGQLRPADLAAEVRALNQQTVVASSLIDSDGHFALVLPLTKDVLSVEIVEPAQRAILTNVIVCTTTDAVDLGEVVEYDPREPACALAQPALQSCIDQFTERCRLLQTDINECVATRMRECQRAQEAFDSCSSERECREAQNNLEVCRARYTCDRMATSYREVCTEFCQAERAEEAMQCGPVDRALPLKTQFDLPDVLQDCLTRDET